MFNKHLLILNRDQELNIRKRQRIIRWENPEDKTKFKHIFAHRFIRKWHAPVCVKKNSRNENVKFPKSINSDDLKVGLTSLYETVVKYAVPEMNYPLFHETVLSTIQTSTKIDYTTCTVNIPSILEAASVCAYYHLSTFSLKRAGGFKNIPMEPYLINLFHRAVRDMNDGLMYCFIYTVLSWTLFSMGKTMHRKKYHELIQTPVDPSFQLYYKLPQLLERVSTDTWLPIVAKFLMFSQVTHLNKDSLNIFLRLYSWNEKFVIFLRRNDFDIYEHRKEIEERWMHPSADAQLILAVHELFESIPLVGRVCNLLVKEKMVIYKGKLDFLDVSTYLVDVTTTDIIYAFYEFALSPSFTYVFSNTMITGFRSRTTLVDRKTNKIPQPQLKIDETLQDYNTHAQILENDGEHTTVSFNTTVLEKYIGSLERYYMAAALYPTTTSERPTSFLSNISDKTNLYFSSSVNLPIYATYTGEEILTTNNSFFLPI